MKSQIQNVLKLPPNYQEKYAKNQTNQTNKKPGENPTYRNIVTEVNKTNLHE